MKQKDYGTLRETEKVRDAVKLTGTLIKDYSLTHICTVEWGRKDRTFLLKIGGNKFIQTHETMMDAVHKFIECEEDYLLPRMVHIVDSYNMYTRPLEMNSRWVNQECLRDRVIELIIGSKKALIDLEELLKATRMA